MTKRECIVDKYWKFLTVLDVKAVWQLLKFLSEVEMLNKWMIDWSNNFQWERDDRDKIR